MLTCMVYEKQQKLRTMMMMHGLGNKAYWMISYAYFLVLSTTYVLCFLLFSMLTGTLLFLILVMTILRLDNSSELFS